MAMAKGSTKNSTGITQSETVRQALAVLGNDAKNVKIREFVKKNFNLDLDSSTASSYRSQILKQQARKSGVMAQPTPSLPADAGFNKREAVQTAMAKLGDDAKPAAIQNLIKKKNGVILDTKMISSYKINIQRKATAASGVIPQPRGAALSSTGEEIVTIDDLLLVKKLVGKIGAEKVRELAEVLAL